MMKSLALAYALLASTSAFAPTHTASRHTLLRATEGEEIMEQLESDVGKLEAPVVTPGPVVVEPTIRMSFGGAAALSVNSQALPFMTRPATLDGTLAGDVGFDPLGFAKSREDLMNYREAEVKHARLAMLAAAGWPLSEVLDKKLAAAFGMNPLLDDSDRVPSLLNGGLGKISPAYWVGCLGVAAMIDVFGQLRMKKDSDEYLPGDFGLRLGYPESEAGQQRMQLAEIKNGRLAMIAIFGFAVQEFISKQGVVDETPFFFYPIAETMHRLANSGYIQ